MVGYMNLFISANANSKKKPKMIEGPWEKKKANKVGKTTIPLNKAMAIFGRLGHNPTMNT